MFSHEVKNYALLTYDGQLIVHGVALRKAYTAEDFEQLFRIDEQPGLFDRPIEYMQPIWIRCQATNKAGTYRVKPYECQEKHRAKENSTQGRRRQYSASPCEPHRSARSLHA